MSERSVRRVVVADDEVDIADLLTFNLEAAGYEVTAAHDGDEALALVRSMQPDVVVLDVMMPKRSGFEVLAELRADAATSAIPVVMLSAKAADADVAHGWNAGVDYYLTKPFDLDELMRFIASLQVDPELTR